MLPLDRQLRLLFGPLLPFRESFSSSCHFSLRSHTMACMVFYQPRSFQLGITVERKVHGVGMQGSKGGGPQPRAEHHFQLACPGVGPGL